MYPDVSTVKEYKEFETIKNHPLILLTHDIQFCSNLSIFNTNSLQCKEPQFHLAGVTAFGKNGLPDHIQINFELIHKANVCSIENVIIHEFLHMYVEPALDFVTLPDILSTEREKYLQTKNYHKTEFLIEAIARSYDEQTTLFHEYQQFLPYILETLVKTDIWDLIDYDRYPRIT